MDAPQRDDRADIRKRLHEIIFESDTPSGKAFDVLLIVAILASVAAVMLDSVESVSTSYGPILRTAEWVFTILFTVEYVLRLYCVDRPWRYALSFYGLVDLFSIVPTYLSLFLTGAHVMAVIRMLRILRIFRVLKLGHHMRELETLRRALWSSRRKITVFFCAVVTLTVILGSLMYLVEGPEHGFTSIPRGVYWAVVTLTTVGYGDISPATGMGQALASVVMIMGYAILAVPTGIVTAELTQAALRVSGQACPSCASEGHTVGAGFCKDCGARL